VESFLSGEPGQGSFFLDQSFPEGWKINGMRATISPLGWTGKQEGLLRVRGCRASSCRSAEDVRRWKKEYLNGTEGGKTPRSVPKTVFRGEKMATSGDVGHETTSRKMAQLQKSLQAEAPIHGR